MIFQNTFIKLKGYFIQKKLTIPILILGLTVLIFSLLLFLYSSLNPSLNTRDLSDYSKVIPSKATNYFILQKDDG